MDLLTINEQLEKLLKTINIELRKLHEIEYAYNKRYFDLLLSSHMMSADKREAEVKAIIDSEGLYKPFLDAKIEFRTLLHERDILIEIAKNIRILQDENR